MLALLHSSEPIRSNLHTAGSKWEPWPRTVLGQGIAKVNLSGPRHRKGQPERAKASQRST